MEANGQTPPTNGAKDNSPQETKTIMDSPIIPDSSGPLNSDIQHVQELATLLFDRTQLLHDLNEESCDILKQAVTLCDIPLPQTKKKCFRALQEKIQSSLTEEVSPEEIKILAAVIAYHRKRIKKKDFSRLGLPPIHQRQALTIAALLKIALGLNSSGSQQTQIERIEADRDELLIVLNGPQAVADASQAQQNATLWTKIGYPKVTVLESSEASARILPFPKPSSRIGLEPSDSLAEAGRKVMRHHFAVMLQYEEGTRLGEDIEALHNMRVATRRLRAAFEVFDKAFEPKALKTHLKGLRDCGRCLGKVRDLDVFVENIFQFRESLPEEQRQGLDPLLAEWKEQRDAARTIMLAHLNGPEYHAFKRRFNIFLHTPGAGDRFSNASPPTACLVRELAPVLIYSRLASVRSFGSILENAPIEKLHALRIELKKLRYSVEYFQEVLGKQAKEVIEDLKMLQDHLGHLNDAHVATQILQEFIDNWEPHQATLPISERQSLEMVVNYMASRHAERHKLMATFQQSWEYLNRPEFMRKLALAISAL